MDQRVAIVGAGAAGAAAAHALRNADVDVTVYEKSRGVCGRAATRRKDDCTYEYGANYLRDDDERVNRLVTEELPTEGLIDVAEPVWTFDADGEISEGRDDDSKKWTYEDGITQLGKRLFAATDATVHRETPVTSLTRESDGWQLAGADGDLETADAVLLTPPAPQTADLLGSAGWEHDDCRTLREAIASVPYRTVVSAVLHYSFEIDRPYYALVNEDEAHDVGWVAREECKPGHVPDGETLLLVQLAPDWSAERFTNPIDEQVDAAATLTAELLGDDRLERPDWTDHQGWRYGLPDAGADADGDALAVAREHDLFFAGDWVTGEARLHAALRSGLDAGERIADHLA